MLSVKLMLNLFTAYRTQIRHMDLAVRDRPPIAVWLDPNLLFSSS